MSYENAKLMNLEDGQLLLSVLDKRKADIISVSDTTPEPVKTFSDGADGLPMAMIVGIEPVQDLHGQENPYPAGGGKNLLPPLSTETKNGVTITVANDGTITINGTATADTYFERGFTASWTQGDLIYLCAFNPTASSNDKLSLFVISDHGNPQLNLNTANAITSIQASVSANVTKYRLRVPKGVAYSNFVVKLMFQIGGTAPTSYAPYSNVCPISGWTEEKVTRTGKNLANFINNKGINTDGTVNNYNGRAATVDPIIIKQGKQYKYLNKGSTERACIYSVFNGDTLVRRTAAVPSGSVLNTSNGDKLYVCAYGTEGVTVETDKPMVIFADESDTAYEPYTGTTYSITFPSSAGTVYGGTLTVNADGTGTLVVDRALVTLNGSESWGDYSQYEGYYTQPAGMKAGIRQDGISNMLKDSKNSSAGQKNAMWLGVGSKILFVIGVYETMGSTIADFKQYLSSNNLQVVIPLETPQTYILSAPQVETLKGMNNLWADTGDIKAVDYPADTKLYIDGKVAELQALILENISNS